MGNGHLNRHVDRIRAELREAFTEERTPRELAGSFALGTFITMLPTLGVGLVLFVVILHVTTWVSKLALFATLVVFNPVVKWGVYAGSLGLGVVLLGPVEGVSTGGFSLDAGSEILLRLLVGNLILTVIVTILSYVVVYRLARRFESSPVAETIDEALEEIADEVLDPEADPADD
ncbi:DUF2062 domain-containing protein [Halopiger goleimassiliensis]|uniref:DUF2062 domain-containing protein n=1 Tax=Halopiger goleimassiliensis TaxID=1293048 RepID=UPI0006778AB3|nr:DUF2062 domain-containing protein [Halopiger goleimassiliensis]